MSEQDLEQMIKEVNGTQRASFSQLDDGNEEKSAQDSNNLELNQQRERNLTDMYYSEMTFSEMTKIGLREDVLMGLHDKGFNNPSDIQRKTLPIILRENVNLIAQSQSGTGKTCCFAIAMIQAVDPSKQFTQALCVTPTLELADQTFRVVQALGKHVQGLKVRSLLKSDIVESRVTEHILIGAPGKIKSLIQKRLIDVRNMRVFVVDEADDLLIQSTNKSKNDVLHIVKSISVAKPRVLLFSATYKEEMGTETQEDREQEEKILQFAKHVVPEPRKFVLIPREALSLENMRQYYIECTNAQDKVNVLAQIYATLEVGQCIIFMNRRDYADNLYLAMQQAGHKISLLHGKLDPQERKEVINLFRENINKVLISTNVLARGIDVRTVTHVINFELPVESDKTTPDYSTYLHRIGRTARFGDTGVAINFVETDIDKRNIGLIEQYFGIKIAKVNRENIEQEIQ